jgi:hypothetical protein
MGFLIGRLVRLAVRSARKRHRNRASTTGKPPAG